METVITWLILILVALYVVVRRQSKEQEPNDFPVQGKIIYADQGRKSKTFTSYRHKIRAKPDFLVKQQDGSLILLEYKSRQKPPNPSDVVQLVATAIAVKEQYPELNEGMVYTRAGKRWVNLSGSTDELADRISVPLASARAVRANLSVCATPMVRKCRSCSYRTECSDKAA